MTIEERVLEMFYSLICCKSY